MYVLISVVLISLLILGIIIDYISTVREKHKIRKSQNIAKYLKLINNGQKILNGRTILPLTVQSSIVCLERTYNALTELLNIQPSKVHQELLANINKSLINFRALPQTRPYFYSLQQIPAAIKDQVLMLKQSMLLVIILNSEHTKGRISVEQLAGEVEQLEILNARLKAAGLSVQAMQELESGGYPKAKLYIDNAIPLLQGVKCNNEEVTALLGFEIEKMYQLKAKITQRIEKVRQVNADINRKNKNKSKISINKYKYKTPDEEFLVFESNDDNDADNDGLDRIFNNGNKTKY